MNNQIIAECERAHYLMQLSSYFSELTDLPGVSFAYTNLVTDTWYNQAYSIQTLSSRQLTLTNSDILTISKKYFSERNRETCFYLSPASTPSDFGSFLESNDFATFDEEAWMFFDIENFLSRGHNFNVTIKEITKDDLDLFGEVYYRTLPGPEVNEYIQCVINGFLLPPPFVTIKYYLAYWNEKAIGMLSMLSIGKYSGLYAIAVDEEFQHKGVCRALVSKAVTQCKSNKTKYLFLQTGNGEDSQKVFERLGFNTEFIRIGYVSKSVADDMQHG